MPNQEILDFEASFAPEKSEIMAELRSLITTHLPTDATAKIWHGAPVWFIGENPVVGYSDNKRGVCLLFWNGQKFETPGLAVAGKHFAAEKAFRSLTEFQNEPIAAWLAESATKIWDSKAFMKAARAATNP